MVGNPFGRLTVQDGVMRRSIAILLLVASGCGGLGARQPEAAPGASPTAGDAVLSIVAEARAPVATLEFEDQHQRAALGTRCWATSCVDYIGPPPPRSFTRVPQGVTLRLDAVDARVSAMIGRPPEEEYGQTVGAREMDLTDGRERLDLPPGRYVLELFVRWRSQGDAVFTLGLEIV